MTSTHDSAKAVAIIVTRALHRPDRQVHLPETMAAAMALDLARAALGCLVTAVERIAEETDQTPDAVWQTACLAFAAKTIPTTGDTDR